MTLRLLTVVGLASLVTPSGAEPLRQTQTIELPGVNGRIDHLAFDPGTNRLFVAAQRFDPVEDGVAPEDLFPDGQVNARALRVAERQPLGASP